MRMLKQFFSFLSLSSLSSGPLIYSFIISEFKIKYNLNNTNKITKKRGLSFLFI